MPSANSQRLTRQLSHGLSPSISSVTKRTDRDTRINKGNKNPAKVATALLIEKTLQDSNAYRKIDDSLYVLKQGSAYVMISVVPWGDNKAMVRCVSQLVKGVDVAGPLEKQLLELNGHLRFGAVAWEPTEHTVQNSHTNHDKTTHEPEELMATLRDVA